MPLRLSKCWRNLSRLRSCFAAGTLARMRAPGVLVLCSMSAFAAAPKVHTVTLGPSRRVPYVAADVSRESKSDEAGTLRVRALFIDGKQRDWTVGDLHEVTDRSFVVRRALHVNDALPGERSGRWVWQPAGWLLVDRFTAHVTALHLPEFDAEVSDVTWYRDYAAYCGVHVTAKNSGLSANVWQIGARKPALSRVVASWPQTQRVRPVCAPAVWQR